MRDSGEPEYTMPADVDPPGTVPRMYTLQSLVREHRREISEMKRYRRSARENRIKARGAKWKSHVPKHVVLDQGEYRETTTEPAT